MNLEPTRDVNVFILETEVQKWQRILDDLFASVKKSGFIFSGSLIT